MEQISPAHTGFERVTKRKRALLDEMNPVIPWTELLTLIAAHAPADKTGRPQFATEVMLRTHLLQQFFGYSDPAMEEALYDIPLYREFAHLDADVTCLPDESAILRFRHMLEKHGLVQQILAAVNTRLMDRGLMLKTGTVVDAMLVLAPGSARNDQGERDPMTHQTEPGNQWHCGVDEESGRRRTVTTTGANTHDITQAAALQHGQDSHVAHKNINGGFKSEVQHLPTE